MFRVDNLKKVLSTVAWCSPGALYLYYELNRSHPRKYTTEEVQKHNIEGDAWVTYKNKVYDITNFIEHHPGGKDTILMAVGDSVDFYWNRYKQHNTKYVKNILDGIEIGELSDYKSEILDNEYGNDPMRDVANLRIHKQEPFNAEINCKTLIKNYITPEKDWFIRNHHPVPDIDTKYYELSIGGAPFTYGDILSFPNTELVSTIQCAGNRRAELNVLDKTMGLPWKGGAISTGKWWGVWLNDIIDIPKNKKYINLHDYNQNFSVSVPIDADIFLAYKMNGEILSRDRGYPVRVIVPGYTGSKHVKWIQVIEFSDKEVDTPWQTGIAYKKFPPDVKNINDITDEHKKTIPTIDILPVQSYICSRVIKENNIIISGYAMSGGGKNIKSVEVSNDNGDTWSKCKMNNGEKGVDMGGYAWVFWEVELPYKDGDIHMCRATDELGNTQNQSPKDVWNIRGIMNNSCCKKPPQL